MQPHLHPPMTPRHRVFLAVTVLSFLTVIGLVIGCDSDDGPKVTAPAPGGGGGGNGTPTRNMTAEQQGRDGLEETENGTMIRNKGEVALNVRFNYDDPRHYRLNADTAMPSDPANAGSAPARVACGVPATGRANGQCFNNDGVTAPEPYSPQVEPPPPPRICTLLAQDNLGLSTLPNGYVGAPGCGRTVNIGFRCSTTDNFQSYRLTYGGDRRISSYGINLVPLNPLSCQGRVYTEACEIPKVPVPSGSGYRCENTGATPVAYSGDTRDRQAETNGRLCFETDSRQTRNACTNYDLIVGVHCEGETSFRRVIRYSAGQTGDRNQAGCSSGNTFYAACTAPARPRSTSADTYQCYRT